MTLPIILFPTAKADAERAAHWLDEQRPGLGHEFLLLMDDALARIAAYPGSWAVFRKPFRRVILHRFRYAIVYVVRPKQIDVVAVMHCRRDPACLASPS